MVLKLSTVRKAAPTTMFYLLPFELTIRTRSLFGMSVDPGLLPLMEYKLKQLKECNGSCISKRLDFLHSAKIKEVNMRMLFLSPDLKWS